MISWFRRAWTNRRCLPIRRYVPVESPPSDELSRITALVDALEDGHNLAADRAVEAELTRLLPRLRPEDATEFDNGCRRRLFRVLQFSIQFQWPVYHDVPFVLAILQALGQIGDAEALRYAEPLAASCAQPEIREAAQACAASIYERMDRERIRRTLLRGSELPSDRLLRPARDEPGRNPPSFLRPADGIEEGD